MSIETRTDWTIWLKQQQRIVINFLSRFVLILGLIALMISLALRFVPMLLEEYERLRMAQMARGADFTTGSLALRIRAMAALTVPLLLSAFRLLNPNTVRVRHEQGCDRRQAACDPPAQPEVAVVGWWLAAPQQPRLGRSLDRFTLRFLQVAGKVVRV